MHPPVDYVMFGHSDFFGDFTDLIRERDGHLKTIVTNVPEKPRPGRLTLDQWIARFDHKIEVVPLSDWKVRAFERYLIGFSGQKMEPLVAELKEKHGIKFENLISPTAVIPKTVSIEPDSGVIIGVNVIVRPFAKIGRHTIINHGTIVGHASIGDYCFIGPGVTVCGYVTVGNDVMLGANSVIVPDKKVGDHSVVAAGSSVIEDVPPKTLVAGVPAVKKKAL